MPGNPVVIAIVANAYALARLDEWLRTVEKMQEQTSIAIFGADLRWWRLR